MSRKPISHKLRFNIFKRDAFTCQYCGQTPPNVVLEIDHVVPVVEGGDNCEDNLLTSCFNCNRGKGSEPLGVAPSSIEEKAALLKEKQAQLKAYNNLLKRASILKQSQIQSVVDVYDNAFEGWSLTDSARASISNFLERLPSQIVVDAMLLATQRTNEDRAFRYFCGVCWRLIKNDRP